MRIAAAFAAAIAFSLIALFLTVEGLLALTFGWAPFLTRVSSRITIYWPSVWVAAIAFALFAAGVHGLGRNLTTSSAKWRPRWTFAVVIMVFVMFAAGISMVGIVHQVGWLTKSKQPLLGEHLDPRRVGDVRNNLRMIASGMDNFDWTRKRFPAATTLNAEGEELHGWETQILPLMSYTRGNIDLKKRWNDPTNQKYFKCIIPDFINPGFRPPPLEDAEGYGLNHFSANSRVILPEKSPGPDELENGASKTILLGEVNADFSAWGRPLNVRDPNAGINRGPDGFGGPSGEGALFAMADGSTRFIANDVDPAVLKALSGVGEDDAQPSED